MKRLLFTLLSFLAFQASAQSPGVAITNLPSTTVLGAEEIPVAQPSGGGGCPGITVISGFCGARITPSQIQGFVNAGLGTFAFQNFASPPAIGGIAPNAISVTTINGSALPPSSNCSLGYIGTPVNSQGGASYTLVASDSGKVVLNTNAGATTFTIPPNSGGGSVAFPVCTCVIISNGPTGGSLTLAITTDTLYWLPSGATGSRTIAAFGAATVCKWYSSTQWAIVSSLGVT